MVLTTRGRTAYGLVVATLLTVAAIGWESRTSGGRRSSPAGDGTVAVDRRPTPTPTSTPPGQRPAASVPPPALGTPPLESPSPPVPRVASGRLVIVPGDGPVRGTGRLRRYRVAVEAGLPESPAAFAAKVAATLADPRAWGAGGRLAFQRVGTGPVNFTVVLASPATTDRLCRPLNTAGIYSCFSSGRSVVSYLRWRIGAPAYDGDLESYRQYVVLHEVGHALGHDHETCSAPGGLAPTMMQQTKGVSACRPNPWPFPTAA